MLLLPSFHLTYNACDFIQLVPAKQLNMDIYWTLLMDTIFDNEYDNCHWSDLINTSAEYRIIHGFFL